MTSGTASSLSALGWTGVVVLLGLAVTAIGAETWRRQVAGAAVSAGLLVLLAAGALRALDGAALGLVPVTGTRCVAWSGAAVAGALIVLAVLATRPSLVRGARDPRFEKLRGARLAAKLLALIPVTVAFEELAFRGLLFHLWERSYPVSAAVPVGATAIAFGLWHVAAALASMRAPGTSRPASRAAVVATTVLATTIAGAGFALARISAGCVYAPFVLHWGANAIGVVAVIEAARLRERGEPPR